MDEKVLNNLFNSLSAALHKKYKFSVINKEMRDKIAYDIITIIKVFVDEDNYRVVCDETNNPPMIIDNNNVVVDVFFENQLYTMTI